MSIKFTFAPEITDEVILQAFEGTSFGRTDYREFLGYSVLQKVCGWHCGFTITNIMIGLKLITPEHHRVTKLGRMFLSDCYDDPLRTPEPVSQRYKLPELNEELINILGRPNFTCSYAAMVLRKGGMKIKRKSEHEQAAVIHFLLGHYLKHGDKWFVEADKELIEIAATSAEVK